MILFSFISAQDVNLKSCHKFQEKSSLFSKTEVFNGVGINLSKYDWSNPTLNCHINSGMYFAKKSKMKRAGAITAVSVGGVFFMGGATILASVGGGGGAALVTLGCLGIGGSVPLFIFSKKDKVKMNEHVDQVSNYYRVNNLF